MIRVIVADDHPVVVAGIKAVLERQEDIRVEGEASNGHELVELLKRQPCDVILTDFSMPPDSDERDAMASQRYGDGLPLLELLASRYPQIPVIVHTMVNNVAVLRTVQEKGVLGLADKRSMAELVQAVRAVVQRKPFMSASLRERFEQSERESPTATTNQPSPREMEVFRLYVTGLTVTQIAERLSRSVKTVSTQKRAAMKKLGLNHDTEIVTYAKDHGII